MKLELQPTLNNEVIPHCFKASKAGFSPDGAISWIYEGPLLHVLSADRHQLILSWKFGKTLKDPNTVITCVTSFKCYSHNLLLVATTNESSQPTQFPRNLISVLGTRGRRTLLRSIEIPQKVTTLEVLFTNIEDEVPSWVINKNLQFFSGLVAVGTEGGNIYLIDLCLNELDSHQTTEADPLKLSIVSPEMVDIKEKKEQAASYHKVLGLFLNEMCHGSGRFYYRRQDNTVQKVLEENEVCITSLKYLPQAGVLAVGFNFGSFQLWRIYNPVLDYSSRYALETKPVSNFVVQEPENDPRNFVYLWVAYDNSVLDYDGESDVVSSISLYQLCFAKKDLYSDFGVFYDEMESVCLRLEHNLTCDAYSKETRSTWNSQIVNCFTLSNPNYKPPTNVASDSIDESHHGYDLSLSLFVWRAESKKQAGQSILWMCIFDLNRWYHAQMPHGIKFATSSTQLCPYWAVYKLDEVMADSTTEKLLSVEFTGDKVIHIRKKSPLPEEHTYPSSLQLEDIKFVRSDCAVRGRCLGWQGQLISDLVADAPKILAEPSDFYHMCVRAGLIPQRFEESKLSRESYHMNALLDLALERNRLSCLSAVCIPAWSNGALVQPHCSLTALLNWAWDSVCFLKKKLDLTCDFLFDWSEQLPDLYFKETMRTMSCNLAELRSTFKILKDKSGPTTVIGELEISVRLDIIDLLLKHMELVKWCTWYNLLPEMDEASIPVPGLFAYPFSQLCSVYKNKRDELSKYSSTLEQYSLLMIDNLVVCEGEHITKLWEEDMGDGGLYPPPSMQALVNMYLLDEISTELKLGITLYLLQDLAELTPEVDSSVVAGFIQSFLIRPGLVRQIRGMWFLDHSDFEEGARQFMNPNLGYPVGGQWHDAALVNILVARGEYRVATRFVHTGHTVGFSEQEQKLYISVLLGNKKAVEALEYTRQHQNKPSYSNVMDHLFYNCQKNKMLAPLIQYNLDKKEEEEFESFLRKSPEPQALDPLFLYYISHKRFKQAYRLNIEMNRLYKLDISTEGRYKSDRRNKLMQAHLKALPDITRKLIIEQTPGFLLEKPRRIRVCPPTPLSTVVRNADRKPMCRSEFVLKLMEKVQEVEQVITQYHNNEDESFVSDDLTFLKSPSTPKKQSIITQLNEMSSAATSGFRLPESAAKQKALELNLTTEELKSFQKSKEEFQEVLRTPVRGPKKMVDSPARLAETKTPQSILKIRRLSSSLISSGKEFASARKTPPKSKTKTLKSSASLVTSPASERSPPVIPRHDLRDTEVPATPKQLRFVGLSPSPLPSPSSEPRSIISTSQVIEVSSPLDEPDVNQQQEPEVKLSPCPLSARTTRYEGSKEYASPRNETTAEEAMEVNVEEVEVLQTSLSNAEVLHSSLSNAEVLHTSLSNAEANLSVRQYEEGSPDRYKEMTKLVRHDLQSPWKSGTEQANTSWSVQPSDHSSFRDSQSIEKDDLRPSLTSSPVERTELEVSSTVNKSLVIETKQVTEEGLEKFPLEMLKKISPRADVISVSAEDAHKSPRMRKREDSPPVTPPLSKKAKLLGNIHDEDDTSSIIERPYRLRASSRTPEKKRLRTPEVRNRASLQRQSVDTTSGKEATLTKFESSFKMKSQKEERHSTVSEVSSFSFVTTRASLSPNQTITDIGKKDKSESKIAIEKQLVGLSDKSVAKSVVTNKSEEFFTADEFMEKLDEKEESSEAIHLTRRRSTRLNTPDRATRLTPDRSIAEILTPSSRRSRSKKEPTPDKSLFVSSPGRSSKRKTDIPEHKETKDISVLNLQSGSEKTSTEVINEEIDTNEQEDSQDKDNDTNMKAQSRRSVRGKTPELSHESKTATNEKKQDLKSPSRRSSLNTTPEIKAIEPVSPSRSSRRLKNFEDSIESQDEVKPLRRSSRSKTPELLQSSRDTIQSPSRSTRKRKAALENIEEDNEEPIPSNLINKDLLDKSAQTDFASARKANKRKETSNVVETPVRQVSEIEKTQKGRHKKIAETPRKDTQESNVFEITEGNTETKTPILDVSKTEVEKPKRGRPKKISTTSKSVEESEEETNKTSNTYSRTRRSSKTPERSNVREVSVEADDELNTSVLRRSRRQSRTPDRFVNREESEFVSLPLHKRSAITDSPVSPARHSQRNTRTPARLNTDQIEPMAPISPKRSPIVKPQTSPQTDGSNKNPTKSDTIAEKDVEEEKTKDEEKKTSETKVVEQENQKDETSRSSIGFKTFAETAHLEPVEKFVFSPPVLRKSSKSVTSSTSTVNQTPISDSSTFVFSNPEPVLSPTEPKQSRKSSKTLRTKRHKGSPEEMPTKTSRKSIRKTLLSAKNLDEFTEDLSPQLLKSPAVTRRRARVSEAQRATIKLVKKYKSPKRRRITRLSSVVKP